MTKKEAPPPLTTGQKLKVAGGCLGVVVLIIIIVTVCVVTTSKDDETGKSPEQIVDDALNAMPIVEGHNNFPRRLREKLHNDLSRIDFSANLSETSWMQDGWTHTDLPKLREGRVGAEFWVALIDCKSQYKDAVMQTLEQIDVIKRLVDEYSDDLQFSTQASDIETARDNGKIASFIAVGGGHLIQSSLAVLRMYYELGVRYLALTFDCNTPWADTNTPTSAPSSGGLSVFGWNIIEEMNRLGMMIDLSHASQETAIFVFKITKSPAIFSHAGGDICKNSPKYFTPELFSRLKDNGGVIMVGITNLVCNGSTATIYDVADHIDFIKNSTGIDHVGIGGDFDGNNTPPEDLENPSKYPDLFLILARDRGYSGVDLEKISGRNLLRVFKENERIRDELLEEGKGPNQNTISLTDFINHDVPLTCISDNYYINPPQTYDQEEAEDL